MKIVGIIVLVTAGLALFGRGIAGGTRFELLFEVLTGLCLLCGILLYGFGSVVEAIRDQSGSE